MKINMGAMDSWIRIFVGVWVAYAALVGYIGCIGYLGFLLLATGLARVCPGYCLLGINTDRCEAKDHH